MKIIAKDNFDREIFGSSDDRLVAENITDQEYGECMVEALNAKFCQHPNAPLFYKLVEDAHKLLVFEP